MSRLLFFLLLLFVPAAIPAQVATTAPQAADANAYVLGPGDVLEVEVLGQADFGKPRLRVRPDGTVPLPVLGDVPAANLTVTEFARRVERLLIEKQYYTAPSVNADVVSYASRYVVVLGGVGQPGLVPVDRAYRVSEILARAGGAKDGSQYVILSSPSGQERKILIDQLARSVAADPFVAPNDKVFVPEPEMFYVYGQVNAPGTYPIRDGMTVRQALARGGGLTASGSEKKITVHRNERKLKLGLDTTLLPGDVLVVGERFF